MCEETKTDLKEVQEEMLELLKRFHSVCCEYQIKYSVYGGTLIGIIREHGFIPWDDDADVSFTRDEFSAFSELLIKNDVNALFHAGKGEYFYFSRYDNAFPQLWMIREGHPAVWIDLFIYDCISEHKIVQKIKFFKLAMLLGLLKNKETMKATQKRGLYTGGKYVLIYLSYLVGRLIPEKKKYSLADSIRQSSPGQRTLIHRSNDRYVGIKFIYPEYVMQDYIILPFCDIQLMVTRNYDDILIPTFGDYMTPVKDNSSESDVHTLARGQMPAPIVDWAERYSKK